MSTAGSRVSTAKERSRNVRGSGDAASVLRAYVLVLFAIPAALAVPALGTAGGPATILAIVVFLWWIWHHLHRGQRFSDARLLPTRRTALVFLFIILVVYVHGMSGAFLADELTPADSGLLKVVGLTGLVLVAGEGMRSLERHRAVVRTLVVAIGLTCVLAMVQAFTKQPWVDRISIPGLSSTATFYVDTRNGFARPSGTAIHPIEFGVTLTMGLPLVTAFALHSPTARWRYRLLLLLMAFAIFLSISRSAIICGAAAVLVMALRWTWKMRAVASVFMVAMVAMVSFIVPGLLGTLTGLFTGISGDNSAASRTGSYDVAELFISRSPLLGRGFGTFLPKYQILDNAYLGLLIDSGILGLLALLALIGTAVFCARDAAKHSPTDFDAEIAHGLMAGIVAGAVGFLFFDGFAFPQAAGTWFLLMGLAGASRRLVRSGSQRSTPDVQRAPEDDRVLVSVG